MTSRDHGLIALGGCAALSMAAVLSGAWLVALIAAVASIVIWLDARRR